MPTDRRAITVQGVVQGVGFRPFVYDLATRLGLTGFVRNDSGNVRIEAEGSPDALDELLNRLTNHPPPLPPNRWQVAQCFVNTGMPRTGSPFKVSTSA